MQLCFDLLLILEDEAARTLHQQHNPQQHQHCSLYFTIFNKLVVRCLNRNAFPVLTTTYSFSHLMRVPKNWVLGTRSRVFQYYYIYWDTKVMVGVISFPAALEDSQIIVFGQKRWQFQFAVWKQHYQWYTKNRTEIFQYVCIVYMSTITYLHM